jgi:hypothetical protein
MSFIASFPCADVPKLKTALVWSLDALSEDQQHFTVKQLQLQTRSPDHCGQA